MPSLPRGMAYDQARSLCKRVKERVGGGKCVGKKNIASVLLSFYTSHEEEGVVAFTFAVVRMGTSPNKHALRLMRAYSQNGWRVVVLSESAREDTASLVKWGAPFDIVRQVGGRKGDALVSVGADVFYADDLQDVEDAHDGKADLAVIHYKPPSEQGISVLTFNISWESTVPAKRGFGNVGKACRSDVGTCRKNVVTVVRAADCDIVALQEVPPEMFDLLKATFSQDYEVDVLYDKEKHGVEGQVTMWKRKVGIVCKSVVHSTFERRSRPFSVLTFGSASTPDFVFVNLHAGHGYRKKRFTEALRPHVRGTSGVVLAGDFNRDMKTLELADALLTSGCAGESVRTCCSLTAKREYKYALDHVMSNFSFSEETRGLYAGFPASDHRPVVANLLLPRCA